MADFVVERILSIPSNFQKELDWMMDEMRNHIGGFDDSKYKFTWIMQKPLMHSIMSKLQYLVEYNDCCASKIFGIDVVLESYRPGLAVTTVKLKAMDRTLHEKPLYIPTSYSPSYSLFDKFVKDYVKRDRWAVKEAFERNLLTVDPWKIIMDESSIKASSINIRLDNERSTMLNFNVKDSIKKVIYNEPATIVYWNDGTRTVVKCGENDTYSKETGLAMCIVKKITGNKGNYNDVFRKWIPTSNKSQNKELSKLRNMTGKLRVHCNGRACTECPLYGMNKLDVAKNYCTGYNASDEELLNNKGLIIARYEAIMKEKENK